MSDETALALLRLLAEQDGLSMPRAAKRLGLGASELHRLLAALGDDRHCGGLGLVESRQAPAGDGTRGGVRVQLWLTERGRALCAGAHGDTA